MCRSAKIFFKVALGLTSAMCLLIAWQVQAAETIKPGAVLLSQSAEPQKEPQKSPGAAGSQAEEKLKQEKTREQEPQMEKQAPKTRGLQRPPGAAGTKKLGGQTIRDKESPEEE